MAFKFDETKHINLNGSIYERSELPEAIITAVQLINNSDQELTQLQHNFNVMKLGREAMVQLLTEKLEDVDAIAEATEEDSE